MYVYPLSRIRAWAKWISYFLLILSVCALSGNAENRVDIDIAQVGGDQTPCDTLWVGTEYKLRVWTENEYVLCGQNAAFQVWSDDGATWEFVSQPDGYGAHGYFTVVEGSRLYPPGEVWNMTGFLVTEQNIDLVGRDSLMYGGIGLNNGIQPGPSEHMVSLHFRPAKPLTADDIHILCFDTSHIPPSGVANAFVACNGAANIPLWGGSLCLPVRYRCGNPNHDNDINVGDAVFMINYVFRDGPAPEPLWLGDANCDGGVDVGDIVFLIAAAFRFGPQPECCEYMR